MSEELNVAVSGAPVASTSSGPSDLESSSQPIPPSLAEFRQQYRSTIVGPYYNGYMHLGFVVVGSTLVIGAALSFVRSPIMWYDWMCIPNTFIVANFVEYFGHRGPMHNYFRNMGLIFHRHTHEHHRFFTEDWMTCRSQRDYKIVLFPPIMLIFYLLVIALPIGVLLALFHTRNTAAFYVATAMFYFLEYELLHFCYHLDESSRVARLPVIRFLREHHRRHHKMSLMSNYNFNITWPIADYFMGTVYREPEPKSEGISK